MQSFLVKHQITQVTQPRFGTLRLLAFPKIKITFERAEFQTIGEIRTIGKIRWDSWWQLGELCEVPRCLLWRQRHHCPVFPVSCIFFNKWLYFSYYMARYLWTHLVISSQNSLRYIFIAPIYRRRNWGCKNYTVLLIRDDDSFFSQVYWTKNPGSILFIIMLFQLQQRCWLQNHHHFFIIYNIKHFSEALLYVNSAAIFPFLCWPPNFIVWNFPHFPVPTFS